MDRPTANEVRAWSRLEFAEFGYTETSDPDAAPDPLDQLLAEAEAYVEQVTGRAFATMPENLVPLAQAAVRMRVEQVVLGAQAESVEDVHEALGGAGIQSFSVPGYSETRFKPEASDWYKRLNTWPALAELLWLLMTPEAQEEWTYRLTGKHAPYSGVVEVDWSGDLATTPLDPFDWYGPGLPPFPP